MHTATVLTVGVLLAASCAMSSTPNPDVRPAGAQPPTRPTTARRAQEAAPTCTENDDFAALSAAVMEQCCPPPQDEAAAADCELPAACDSTICADQYLRFFDSCEPRLATLPPEQLGPLRNFNAACEAFVGGAGLADSVVENTTAGAAGQLLCFEVTCRAPTLLVAGQETGSCPANGALGSACRLTCKSGYEASDAVDGVCEANWLTREEVAVGD